MQDPLFKLDKLARSENLIVSGPNTVLVGQIHDIYYL